MLRCFSRNVGLNTLKVLTRASVTTWIPLGTFISLIQVLCNLQKNHDISLFECCSINKPCLVKWCWCMFRFFDLFMLLILMSFIIHYNEYFAGSFVVKHKILNFGSDTPALHRMYVQRCVRLRSHYSNF